MATYTIWTVYNELKYKNLKYVTSWNVTREVNFVLYMMDLPYVGVSCRMWTELGVDIELRGVSSCDFSQGVYWVKVVDPSIIDQYILLLEDMYEEWFPAFHFHSLVAWF